MTCWQCNNECDIGEVDGLGRFGCINCARKKVKSNVTLSAVIPDKGKAQDEMVITAPIGAAMRKLGWMPPSEVERMVNENARLSYEIEELLKTKVKVDKRKKRK